MEWGKKPKFEKINIIENPVNSSREMMYQLEHIEKQKLAFQDD